MIKEFKAPAPERLPEAFECSWKSPSNIALVKYWGKKEEQIPANPSISFTLDHCATTTLLRCTRKEGRGVAFDLLFEGQPKPSFKPKIEKFLERILPYMPFLEDYHLEIDTSNSFPHSSGIASSASGMSALALCLMSLEKALNAGMSDEYFSKKASFLARLGSGSACRSVEGPVVSWGAHANIDGSSDLYGTVFKESIHEFFLGYQDTILLVDKGEKQVSSTVGHGLMHGHAYAPARFDQAHHNLAALLDVMKRGDRDAFTAIVESEALTLHAMMMSSNPYFILMKPNTLEIINRVWAYREKNDSGLCFTLDAGANVHLLYPEVEKEAVTRFIEAELVDFCQQGQYICDRVGKGAEQLS
ncbi:diphosphomevalonate/mevalonate 3,5-bisphosphate decarboxylase family protein [Robertkochia sediminum]|uniref:diphosphomevalonate/mevalonate 3,5-bisphosphate decarboxylase family protein n=1 Tax=Robertkochia sediminum TaxID=2785326 RepID=UPI00193158B3|nr:diphosphomevalonate decarboxylase [Robertkochia sediminum]MBL7473067.1 diphosphomevalonate decarboxylase [Robertkochia sediminum]